MVAVTIQSKITWIYFWFFFLLYALYIFSISEYISKPADACFFWCLVQSFQWRYWPTYSRRSEWSASRHEHTPNSPLQPPGLPFRKADGISRSLRHDSATGHRQWSLVVTPDSVWYARVLVPFYSCSQHLLQQTLDPSPSIVHWFRHWNPMTILRMVIITIMTIIYIKSNNTYYDN